METPEDFGFPFQPYEIQESFMKKLFQVLNDKQFGIFESRKFTGNSIFDPCFADFNQRIF